LLAVIKQKQNYGKTLDSTLARKSYPQL